MLRAPDILRAIVAPLTSTRFFRLWGPAALRPIERLVSVLTGGRGQVTTILMPSLILHTTGAKSGQPRDAPLMYTPDGHGRAIVAGTNFAGASHPAWTNNLIAHPDAAITVRGRRLRVRASLIPPEERDAVWDLLERQWPAYRGYERDSGRVVRLFVLQPVRDDA